MLIRGVVRGHDGTPLDGVVVSFIDAPTDVADIAAVTGDDGTFVVAAPGAGRYRMALRADGHRLTHIEVVVGEDDADVVCDLDRDPLA